MAVQRPANIWNKDYTVEVGRGGADFITRPGSLDGAPTTGMANLFIDGTSTTVGHFYLLVHTLPTAIRNYRPIARNDMDVSIAVYCDTCAA